ncbi:peroxiredoxin [Cyanobium sp. Morenito 9A2]|uniref:peroxiredoxin n=1 Tax=Cyanobium sp. Morenito 9A2 TaxID=2823718 RepID=UPI0020CC1065|nr:peroxiredoxin [Cyanobium sp. Morenito 9A2]MCP9850107.1 peroxiredoxin [Cyanobium sp. Morenito 9A2]
MNRRQLLGSLGLTTLGLLAFPPQALSLGGVWPELDQPAPDFDLAGVVPEAGEAVEAHRSLGEFAGRWLILYFYPKDFTSGCTLEARGFQRDLAAFHAAGAEVVGVSADDPDSHAAFCGSEKLAYPLLSDPGGTVSSAYGSWIAPFSQRHTFLIDPQGVLRASWRAVRPSGHSQEVLAALQQQRTRG